MNELELKLTPKQAKFLEVWLKTGNATDAAFLAYNVKDRRNARNMGSETLAKLGFTMRDFCAANGISFKELFDKNKELFQAKKIFSSHTEPDKEVPDYQIQDKALDRFERWVGTKDEQPQQNLTQNILVMPSEILDKYKVVTTTDNNEISRDTE